MSRPTKVHNTLAERNREVFQEEHQRLMRSLHESIVRKNDYHRQLRRLQESFVSVALRLQVAIRVAQDDELTILSLRKTAEESYNAAAIAEKQNKQAQDLVQTLRLEISSLKRKLRQAGVTGEDGLGDKGEAGREDPASGSPGHHLTAYETAVIAADKDVDRMMKSEMTLHSVPHYAGTSKSHSNTNSNHSSSSSSSSSSALATATSASSSSSSSSSVSSKNSLGGALGSPLKHRFTPFEEWKMSKYLSTPDMPIVSANSQDVRMVDRLADYATAKSLKENGNKKNTTLRSSSANSSMGVGGGLPNLASSSGSSIPAADPKVAALLKSNRVVI